MTFWNGVVETYPDHVIELHVMRNDPETDHADVFYVRDFMSDSTVEHLGDFLFETSEWA